VRVGRTVSGVEVRVRRRWRPENGGDVGRRVPSRLESRPRPAMQRRPPRRGLQGQRGCHGSVSQGSRGFGRNFEAVSRRPWPATGRPPAVPPHRWAPAVPGRGRGRTRRAAVTGGDGANLSSEFLSELFKLRLREANALLACRGLLLTCGAGFLLCAKASVSKLSVGIGLFKDPVWAAGEATSNPEMKNSLPTWGGPSETSSFFFFFFPGGEG
jgi:hypothetical protein